MRTGPAALITLLSVCVVRDTKAQAVSSLHTQRSDASAVRAFTDAISSGQDSMLRQHPEDFELLRIGFLDDSTGELTVCEPVVLVTAAEVVRRLTPREPGQLADDVRSVMDKFDAARAGAHAER